MKDANFSRTYTIKIHGITGEGDVPRWVHMGLHNTLRDLSKTFKTLHYSISEEEEYTPYYGGSDQWPETTTSMSSVTIKVNASPEPTTTSE